MARLATEAESQRGKGFARRMKKIYSLKKEIKVYEDRYAYFQDARNKVMDRLQKTTIKGYKKTLKKKFFLYNRKMSESSRNYEMKVWELSKIAETHRMLRSKTTDVFLS